ncbi:phosphotransferase family protein [Thermoactinomyces sp. DSM 45892]|uniref:phosphotransferase family protein n=1 Tax=Thermoactinomyces sp. DSM 45892 TaxID=1882753 RepID=UPI00089699E7|nr:phosphotransferase [Thermoactinomyces sp. DSM 45892]SDX97695.1 Phosphotransferase enzyme family protein [Thermoactinomyces sp. DSM 45892]
MNKSIAEEKMKQLSYRIDPQSKLLYSHELKGGVSAQVTMLEVEYPDGHKKKMIIRQHGEIDIKRNPKIALDEFTLLKSLHSFGLPTPEPYYLESSGEIFTTPCIVMEYIEGETQFKPACLSDYILQLAANLAKIHSIDYSKIDLSFLPNQENMYTEKMRNRPPVLDESLSEGRIRDTIELVWPVVQQNSSTILHGDFWPGNLLWKEDQLVGIIDWEDVAFGDPLADVANSRLEILWHFGIHAMNDFTAQYQSIMPTVNFENLPYWDLCAALRPTSKITTWGLDEITLKRMKKRHHLFVNQAIKKILSSNV